VLSDLREAEDLARRNRSSFIEASAGEKQRLERMREEERKEKRIPSSAAARRRPVEEREWASIKGN